MDNDEIRTLVTRLARRHPSGGKVVERAAILAEGADFTAVMEWIMAHGGEAEVAAPADPKRGGLHSARLSDRVQTGGAVPLRFVLPPGALD